MKTNQQVFAWVLFKRAWELAKDAQKKYGHRPGYVFGLMLFLAWAELKANGVLSLRAFSRLFGSSPSGRAPRKKYEQYAAFFVAQESFC